MHGFATSSSEAWEPLNKGLEDRSRVPIGQEGKLTYTGDELLGNRNGLAFNEEWSRSSLNHGNAKQSLR